MMHYDDELMPNANITGKAVWQRSVVRSGSGFGSDEPCTDKDWQLRSVPLFKGDQPLGGDDNNVSGFRRSAAHPVSSSSQTGNCCMCRLPFCNDLRETTAAFAAW
jgi:hypothetical protein